MGGEAIVDADLAQDFGGGGEQWKCDGETTGGNQVSVRGSDRFVPKEKLIGSLEYLFQQNLLKISTQIPQADLLREELRQFERRSQRGGASKLAAGTGHDDMVMALALAGWWAYENKSRALAGPELKALDY